MAALAVTTTTVTTTSDTVDGDTGSLAALGAQPGPDGAVSLREALLATNAMTDSAALTIGFSIPVGAPGYSASSGTWTITLGARALPPLSRGGVTIDGASQPGGSASHPQIVLDGYNVYEAAGLSNGITITSASNAVRGITLMNFYDDAVLIDGPSAAFNQIAGNYIGTSPAGGAPAQTSYFGVEIRNGAHDNTVGGAPAAARNLISGNDTGIYIDGGAATTIAGNTIGLASDNQTPLGNASGGIFLVNGAHDTLIGGASAGMRNIIAGNGAGSSTSGQGIYLANANTFNNTIIGNYVGVDGSGVRPAGNYRQGILVGIGAQSNWIGGSAPGEGNVIAYNGMGGVRIDAPNNHVAGNLIGTGADGSTRLGNQANGVRVGGANNTIGPNNLIAYNQQSGIMLLGSYTTVLSNTLEGNGASGICVTAPNATIDRNLIQSNGAGQGPWPECAIQSGVVITDTTNALVTNNRIFSNDETGITVYGGVSNRILSNSISDNQTAGIRLVRGGNDDVPPPRISSIQGSSVSGSSCAGCRVELFTDTSDEGRYFVGATTASGSGAFSLPIAAGQLRGPHMTATHTDPLGNTSPFGPAVVIPPANGGDPTPTPPRPPTSTRLFLPMVSH